VRVIFFAFNLWVGSVHRSKWSLVQGFFPKRDAHQLIYFTALRRPVAKPVKNLLALEKTAWIFEQADILNAALGIGDMQQVHCVLAAVSGDRKANASHSATSRAADENGKTAKSYHEERICFRKHFGQLHRPLKRSSRTSLSLKGVPWTRRGSATSIRSTLTK
jgi:hypothetical protein